MSKARNAGEIAFAIWHGQPSAEIVSCVSKARNAGEITKIACLEGCLLEWVIFIGFMAPRAGKILTFCECLV